MPLQSNKQIQFETINLQLYKVEFKRFEDSSVNYQVKIKNKISTQKVGPEGFTLRTTRKLSFEPKGAFEINIQFDLVCVFKEDSKKYYDGDISEIEKFIKKRKIEIFNSLEVGNYMSMIISQLTILNDKKTLVTPPFIRQEELG